jgi:hypothetical protein
MAGSAATSFGSSYQENLYDSIKDKPLHVDVVILQKSRTRPYIIEKELQRIQGAHSLDELKVRLLEAQEALEALNIFEAVQITVDAGSPVSKSLLLCCAKQLFWVRISQEMMCM